MERAHKRHRRKLAGVRIEETSVGGGLGSKSWKFNCYKPSERLLLLLLLLLLRTADPVLGAPALDLASHNTCRDRS